jgi:hypothetical protein
MNNLFKISVIVISIISSILSFTSCKKEPVPPVVTTTNVTDITQTAAKGGGNVTGDGGAEVTIRGVSWGTASNPTIADTKTSDGKGTGGFTSSITGLTSNTLYYVRAYATNSEGTSYGNIVSFTTKPITGATLITTNIISITSTAVVLGGNISSDGGASVTARGVCWAITANPTIDNNKTSDGTGTGSFTSNITGLQPATAYHVRAYATNSVGTTYGNDIMFTTTAAVPTVTTSTVSAITQTTATSGGNVTYNGGAAVTARGVCYGTTTGLTVAGSHTSDGTGDGVFTSNLSGLTLNTTYYVRAYATNSAGTGYGDELSFTTEPECALVCNIGTQSYSIGITCESGTIITTYYNQRTEYQYDNGILIGIKLYLNQTRTYVNTNNTYTIVGVIEVNLKQNTESHNITVSGGKFQNPQTCS